MSVLRPLRRPRRLHHYGAEGACAGGAYEPRPADGARHVQQHALRDVRSSSAAAFQLAHQHPHELYARVPPPIRELPEVIEKEIRRIIECSTCHGHYAVFSASAFCPVCGPRPAAETVIDQIESARQALTLEDQLGEDERETLRAAGVFERLAVDALGSVVSLFEVFAREQFALRVSDAESLTQRKGNVFQRLDDSATLFAEHAALDLISLAGAERWTRLKRAFAQRHVLEHRGGIVDERFLGQVPDSRLRAGQRLVVRREDAAAAVDDLDALVRAFPTGRPSENGA